MIEAPPIAPTAGASPPARSAAGSNSLAARRLLDCLNDPLSAPTTAELEHLEQAQWDELAELAARLGLAPLLYGCLTDGATVIRIPQPILQALREAYLINGARNQLVYEDLRRVLPALQGAGIAVLVLKGAHLATLVYRDPARRPMGDIDLMVRVDDLARTTVKLRELGYEAGPQLTGPGLDACQHLPPFSRPPHPRIEIHWTIAEPILAPRIDPAGLWDRSCPATIAGIATRVLSPADLLLHLCLHALASEFHLALRPFCDIAATVRHCARALDWEQVHRRAVEWGVQRRVHLALACVTEFWPTPIPELVLQALRPKDFAARWIAHTREQVLTGEDRTLADTPGWQYWQVLRLGWHCSIRDKLKFLRQRAFPSRNHMAVYMAEKHAVRPGARPAFFGYWVRYFDLLGVGVRWVWYCARHPREAKVLRRELRRRNQFQKWLNRGA